MSISEKQQKNVIERIAKSFRMKNWRCEKWEFETKLQNYFGIIIPVIITGVMDTGQLIVRHVIIKHVPCVESLKGTSVVQTIYKNEFFVYTELRPQFKALETSVNIEELIPECYFVNRKLDNEVLALKDMRSVGFRKFEKESFLDFEHASVTIKALAQYHALSMIIYEKNKNIFDKIDKQYFDTYISSINDSFTKYANLFDGTKYEVFLKDMKENLFKNSTNFSETRLYCCHGDVYVENLLFKYIDGKPSRACIIDYQLSRMMSPAQDVLHFLLGSVDPITRKQNHYVFLRNYIDTVHQVIKECGLDPKILYSKNDFEKELKIVTPMTFCAVFMAHVLWLGLLDKGDVLSKTLCTEKDKDVKENYFKKIIMDILAYLEDFGFITL